MTTNVTEKTFTVEITVTEKEAEFLHTEINKVYMALKDDEDFESYTDKDWEIRHEHLNILRNLRNVLANTTGTFYMGADA